MAISVENSKIFPPPCILELGIGAGVKKLEQWATRLHKKFDDIFSRVDTIHQCDRQTDGQTTPSDSKDRAYT